MKFHVGIFKNFFDASKQLQLELMKVKVSGL